MAQLRIGIIANSVSSYSCFSESRWFALLFVRSYYEHALSKNKKEALN
jgi:hypothetical protein